MNSKYSLLVILVLILSSYSAPVQGPKGKLDKERNQVINEDPLNAIPELIHEIHQKAFEVHTLVAPEEAWRNASEPEDPVAELKDAKQLLEEVKQIVANAPKPPVVSQIEYALGFFNTVVLQSIGTGGYVFDIVNHWSKCTTASVAFAVTCAIVVSSVAIILNYLASGTAVSIFAVAVTTFLTVAGSCATCKQVTTKHQPKKSIFAIVVITSVVIAGSTCVYTKTNNLLTFFLLVISWMATCFGGYALVKFCWGPLATIAFAVVCSRYQP